MTTSERRSVTPAGNGRQMRTSTPSWIICHPMIVSTAPTSMGCRTRRIGPSDTGPNVKGITSARPRANAITPGMRYSHVGLASSRNFRWRQPSGQVWSFDSPTRGRYVIGQLTDAQPGAGCLHDHLRGVLHPRGAQAERWYASASNARMPLWASEP